MVCKRVELLTRSGKRVVFEARVKKRSHGKKNHVKSRPRKRRGTQVSLLAMR